MHRDMQFQSKSSYFACKNHRWGLGPIQSCKSGHKVPVLHEKKTQTMAGTHIDLSFWCKSRCFACTKRQVMPRTHRDLLFRSISCCFASKNHTWGLGPMETSNSDTRHAVLKAENHRWSLGPIETCYSGPEVAVLHAKTTGRIYSPAETCNSRPTVAVLHAQNHRWELEPI